MLIEQLKRSFGESLFKSAKEPEALQVAPSDVAVETALTFPVGALVSLAKVTVNAGPAGGAALLSDVAVVRSGEVPSSAVSSLQTDNPSITFSGLIVDFQRLRTVAAIDTKSAGLYAVYPWAGTGFSFQTPLFTADGSGGVASVKFPETQTERLLLVADSAELSAQAAVALPAPPADLELQVNGKRVWSRPGPVRPNGKGAFFFSLDVDLTAEVQAAVSAGATKVTVSLTSSTPGSLSVSCTPQFFRVATVAFPEGDARTVSSNAEGRALLSIPLPAQASTWFVHEIQMFATADIGPMRVTPAQGPDSLSDLQLILDTERGLQVQLPPEALDAYDKLLGVRVAVNAGNAGAEVVGLLCANVPGPGSAPDDPTTGATPGEPLPGPPLGPLSLPPGGSASTNTWVSLLAKKSRKLTKATPLWLSLSVTRGSLAIGVTARGATPAPPMYIGTAASPLQAMRTISEIAAHGFGAALRLVGESAAADPIPALQAWIVGTTDVVSFTPSSTGVIVVLAPKSAVFLQRSPAFVAGSLQIALLARLAGTFNFSAVRVIYSTS